MKAGWKSRGELQAVTFANCLSAIKKKLSRFTVDSAADLDDPIEDLRLESPFELYISSNKLEIGDGCKYRGSGGQPLSNRSLSFAFNRADIPD